MGVKLLWNYCSLKQHGVYSIGLYFYFYSLLITFSQVGDMQTAFHQILKTSQLGFTKSCQKKCVQAESPFILIFLDLNFWETKDENYPLRATMKKPKPLISRI